MKTKFLIAAAVAVAAYMSAAADTLKGKVSDGNGNPVEYATVVALADSVQRGGTVTDSLGRYSIELPKGTYEIKLTSVGYEPADTVVTVSGTTVVNPVMRMSGVVMQEVEVTASAIRREPDRFVMMVEEARRYCVTLRVCGLTTIRFPSTDGAIRKSTSTTAS